jgi:hypothetical protein
VYSGRWTHSLRCRILFSSMFHLLCFADSFLSSFPATPAECLFHVSALELLATKDRIGFDRFVRQGTQSHEAAFESCGSRLRNLCLFAARLRFFRRLRKARMLYARMKSQPGLDWWLSIFRSICKRESWVQHASTQPPNSGLKFVAES